MLRELRSRRQSGQIAIIMAFGFVAMLGMTGVAVDLGFASAHRREVQNAVDSAALAGAIGLGQHYEYVYNNGTLSANGLTTTDVSDSQLLQNITCAAVAAVPTFTNVASNGCSGLTWPAGGTLNAYYMTNDTTQSTAVGAGYPTNAANQLTATGVRVQASYPYPTFFAKVFGASTINVYASSRAMMRPVQDSGVAGNAPFIVCGGMTGDGAYDYNKNPNPKDQFILDNSTTPPGIVSSYVGDVFLIHSGKLGNNGYDGACGAGASFDGIAQANQTCTPVSATGSPPLPCSQPFVNGNRAGPTRNLVSGMPGCSGPTDDNDCVMILPVANGSSGNNMNVVTYAPFLIKQGDGGWGLPNSDQVGGCSGSNCHTGKLLRAAAIDAGAVAGQVITPTNPGVFTYQSVPE